jgi:predicted alpha-1,2-mannosidase
MKQKMLPLLFFVLTILGACSTKPVLTPAEYVNPFIGTGGHGHTFPGATAPFGMVQLSPDTRLEGWDGCSGYHDSDSIIYGFSHTHLSGTGVADYCDILFMPKTGSTLWQNGYKQGVDSGYASRFRKSEEEAGVGYYRVLLDDYQIEAELTASQRAGFHRYTFPDSQNAQLIIDLTHRDEVLEADIEQVSDTEIIGFRKSNSWASEQYVYFYARFNQPIDSFVIALNDSVHPGLQKVHHQHIKAALHFSLPVDTPLLAKVGISAVSARGAKRNLEEEIPHWDFDLTRNQTRNLWNKELDKIVIEGTPQQKEIFYTSLYHTMIAPNVFMDVDGQYRGTDLQIHQASDFTNYTVFSLWDTYRATHPLYTIIDRDRTRDYIRTVLHQYKHGGQLPVWELAGNYTGCMIGYHSVPVIADAYRKGIQDFDTTLALEAMQHSAMQKHLGLAPYRTYGFIPAHLEHESVSKTLEYAYDDWCIATMARAMGKEEVYDQYIERAQYYKNLFDPQTGFMRPRMYGMWKDPFDPAEVDFNYTEANSWQYSFYVPQDVQGMIALHGGEKAFAAKLDSLFAARPKTSGRHQVDITGLIGQYAHGNEPSHHMAYLYNFVGQPWKTQELVQQIMREMYTPQPDGLIGNEDCGQMSAWYVFSAMGFYPVTPGTTEYILGSPVLERAEIKLENGKTFTITSNASEDRKYVASVKLNGRPWTATYLPHDSIMTGGKLHFEMSEEPVKSYGQRLSDRPQTRIDAPPIFPAPYTNVKRRSYTGVQRVELFSTIEGAEIFYTLDGRSPKKSGSRYEGPFEVEESVVIRFYAKKEGIGESKVIDMELIKFPEGRSISLATDYHRQYTAGGDSALIDGIRGTNDFRLGAWQGYNGPDLNAVVDLGEPTTIHRLTTGFLQDSNSWIFMPERVEYYLSDDGETFRKVGVVENHVPKDKGGVITHDYSVHLTPQKARYVKVVGVSGRMCPDWHKGHGNPLFIFADEIVVH